MRHAPCHFAVMNLFAHVSEHAYTKLLTLRDADAPEQDGSQSPSTPVANAPLALTPVHTHYPEEGSGSVQPPSARLQPARSLPRRGPPARSATFPNASNSALKAAQSATKHSRAQHASGEHDSGISFWEGQHGFKGGLAGGLESVEESMQPGTPTSSCASDAMWEQHPNSSWSVRMSQCKPLRIARQQSGSDASTGRTAEDVSTPCSPKASPKIMVVCRICEEQASSPPSSVYAWIVQQGQLLALPKSTPICAICLLLCARSISIVMAAQCWAAHMGKGSATNAFS